MFDRHMSFAKKEVAFHTVAAAVACAGALACGSGGNPGGPSNNGGSTSCRTVASSTHSVQAFVTGQVVTTDMTCSFSTGSNETVCQGGFTDSEGGPGTITQTTRFASRADVVDEASTNPPRALSLGTTIVTVTGGLSFTITATNAYDSQRRLVSTTIVNPPPLGPVTITYSAWDSSGRPTSGTTNLPGGGSISVSYDAANRSVTRDMGLNICTVTHDSNGIIIRETCTGTIASTTIVTVGGTQSICK